MQALIPAVFLANSWFWCIGGFFAVLLHMEFGRVSFPVFAAFNVVGAAAFGFVFTAARRSALLERMRGAGAAFSAVVVSFHLVFAVWASLLMGAIWPVLVWMIVAVVVSAARRAETPISTALFLLTLGLFALALFDAPFAPSLSTPVQPFIHQIAPLAFGFLLAPYFDLTFHRAYAVTPQPGLTFAIAFGVLFPVLLAGTYFATPYLAAFAAGEGSDVARLILLAVMVQTGFTTSLHVREVGEAASAIHPAVLKLIAAAGVCGALLLFAVDVASNATFEVGALIYRSFVFVIGGVFPVILLFGGLTRACLAALTFISPCYALGFLVGGPWAPFLSVALIGLAVIYLAARVAGPQEREARG